MESECATGGRKMLSLTLKEGQSISIGEDIKVMFAGAESGRIKVLVEAPRSFEIAREDKEEDYVKHAKISEQAKEKIGHIYKQEREKRKHKELVEKRKLEMMDKSMKLPPIK